MILVLPESTELDEERFELRRVAAPMGAAAAEGASSCSYHGRASAERIKSRRAQEILERIWPDSRGHGWLDRARQVSLAQRRAVAAIAARSVGDPPRSAPRLLACGARSHAARADHADDGRATCHIGQSSARRAPLPRDFSRLSWAAAGGFMLLCRRGGYRQDLHRRASGRRAQRQRPAPRSTRPLPGAAETRRAAAYQHARLDAGCCASSRRSSRPRSPSCRPLEGAMLAHLLPELAAGEPRSRPRWRRVRSPPALPEPPRARAFLCRCSRAGRALPRRSATPLAPSRSARCSAGLRGPDARPAP